MKTARLLALAAVAIALSGCAAQPVETLETVTAEARDAGWEGAVLFDDKQAVIASLEATRELLIPIAGDAPDADCEALEDRGHELSTARLGGKDGEFVEGFADDVVRLSQVCQLSGGAAPFDETMELVMQVNEHLKS